MPNLKKLLVLLAISFALPCITQAQEQEEEEKAKMLREVIEVQMERPAAVATPPPVTEIKGKKGKKKPVEEPIVENIDTTGGMIPAPASEIARRAGNWTKAKTKKYSKNNISNSGNNIGCTATFIYKPQELNPTYAVEGEISMEVLVECKEGKYRYTINKIEHKAKKGDSSGGDVFNPIPKCGSIKLDNNTWKRIKSAALVDAKLVADDLKAAMALPGTEAKKDDW